MLQIFTCNIHVHVHEEVRVRREERERGGKEGERKVDIYIEREGTCSVGNLLHK